MISYRNSSGWNTSVIKCCSHKASLAACVNAMNSTSVDERAMIDCF